MEVFTSLLTALITVLSPVGSFTEGALEAAIQEQVHRAEVLAVRVDNRPSYRLLAGQVDQVRIAGRGVYLTPELRIALLDIETDAVDVDAGRLLNGEVDLEQPLQFVARLVIDAADINQALRSPAVAAALQDVGIGALGSAMTGMGSAQAALLDPQVTLSPGNTLRLQGTLRERTDGQLALDSEPDELALDAELTIAIENGYRFSLNDPRLAADGAEFPVELLLPVIQGLNQQLDLRTLESEGITVRVLALETTPQTLEAIAFVRIEPSALP